MANETENIVQAADLTAFMKCNVAAPEGEEYAASSRMVDPVTKGPIKWKLRPLTGEENAALRSSCEQLTKTPGKKGVYITQVNQERYMAKLTAACVVYPDLKNAALQDSYHVTGEESLLREMLLPGEYDDLTTEVTRLNGYASEEALIENAKN